MIRRGYTFDEVLIEPGYNDIGSRRDVLDGAFTSVDFGGLVLSTPIFSANMDTITEAPMANAMFDLGGIGCLHRFSSIEENERQYGMVEHEAVVSLGINEDLERFEALYDMNARFFCVDVAHGHCKAVGQFIKRLKSCRNDNFVIAGNVATYAAADYLAGCGADAIKIGIGPGSACTTRLKTGVGVPQLTAIMDIAPRIDRFTIADGGITKGADFAKAIAAGADAIMIGGMLAGCDETPGSIVEEWPLLEVGPQYIGAKRSYKNFRGMASREAQEDHFGNQDEWKTSEGESFRVPCKGPVANVVSDLMGGLRSAMTYVGARSITSFQKKVTFIEISSVGQIEGEAHGKR